MDKTLYMLIGPKGAGKTSIGTLVGQHTDITFIRVESIWLSLQPGEDGWARVAATIDELFQTREKLMIESLGAGEGFARFYTALRQRYTIKMIRVYADLQTCLTRVRQRDSSEHIPVSDHKIEAYNAIAAAVRYDWDLEIDNEGPASDEAVLAAIRAL